VLFAVVTVVVVIARLGGGDGGDGCAFEMAMSIFAGVGLL